MIYLALISVFLSALGQLCLKRGIVLLKLPEQLPVTQKLISLFTHPFVLLGLMCYGLGAITWILALTKLKLSVAFPLTSLSYIVVVLGAAIFFKETVSVYQVVGLGLILSGVILVTR